MRRLIAVLVLGLTLGAAGAWWSVDRGDFRLVGRLLTVGWQGTCPDDLARAGALRDWRERLLAQVRWVLPGRGADCRVSGVRLARNVIVNTGENYLVNLWIESIRGHRTVGGGGTTYPAALSDFRYHACGSEDTATAEAHTGLVSECTTQTDANNLRGYGTQIVGASPNIYRTQATLFFDATDVITEWGLFHVATVNTGHMWSRVVVTPGIGVNNGDSVTFTYDLTIE